MPIIIFSIFDKELNDKILVKNKLNYYEQGIKSNIVKKSLKINYFIDELLSTKLF